MKCTKLIFLLAIPFQLLGTENLPPQVKQTLEQASTMVNLEGDISTLVNGSVNVITGDYCDTEVDIEVIGAEPLMLTRSHTSSDIKQTTKKLGPLQNTWHLNYGGRTYIHEGTATDRKSYITHDEGSGISTLYEGSYKAKGTRDALSISPKLIKCGMINTGLGDICARTNRKNSRALNEGKQSCQITMSDGKTRYFSRLIPNGPCELLREIQTNGNQIVFGYDHKNRLNLISAQNFDGESLVSSIKFQYPRSKIFEKEPHLIASTHDGRQVRYDFIHKHDRYLLTKVTRPNSPSVEYEYSETSFREERITKKKLPDGRFLGITYYEMGTNKVQGEKVKIVNPTDKPVDRVKELYAPVAADGSAIPIYSFLYESTYKDKDKKFLDEGITTVCDPIGNKLQYRWDDHRRITKVTSFFNQKPYAIDQIYWGADQTSNAGNLISRVFRAENEIQSCLHYTYDTKGNVLQKQFLGFLTGTNTIPPQVNDAGIPLKNGCDACSEYFSYDSDNLKVAEENARHKIIYGYKENTDLLEYQFLCDLQGNIKIRHFYEYNQDAIQVVEIVDDGNSMHKDDLVGVTERKYVRTKPEPTIALPEEIEETNLDLATGTEIFIKKVMNQYDPQGKIVQQTTYNAHNQEAFKLSWTYNDYGQVTKETNALGEETEYQYDLNSNKILERKGSLQAEYRYDQADRLIAVIHTQSDGAQLTERNQYDIASRRTVSEDVHGNQIHYQYDLLGRLIATIYPDKTQTKIAYNALNQAIMVEDGNGNKLHFTYTTTGKPTSITYPDGMVEKMEYTPDGLISRTIARNGTTTIYAYDCQSRLIYQKEETTDGLTQEHSWTYNAFHLLSEHHPDGTTTYQYNVQGELVEVEKHGIKTLYEYDSLGRKYKTIHGEVVSILEYDSLNRVVEERQEDLVGIILSRIWYTYDKNGNKTEIRIDTGTEIAIEQFTFDAMGNVVNHVDAEGNQIQTIIDYNHPNKLGQVKRIHNTLPNGVNTVIIYDVMGRVVRTVLRDPFGTMLKKEENQYDPAGNRIQLTETITINGTSQRQVITKWEYDWFGRVTARIDAFGTPEQKIVRLSYDPKGAKAKLTKADGTEICYENDGLGRLVHLTAQDLHYHYTYDPAGNLTAVNDTIHQTTTERQYDEKNQLIHERLSNDLEVNYTQDIFGRVASITLPDATAIAYHYNGKNLSQIDRIDAQHNILYSHTYDQYDRRGNVLHATNTTGQIETTYDILGRIKAIKAPFWQETNLIYDTVGNIKEQHVEDTLGKYTQNFNYDHQKQITQENENTFTWDSQYNCVDHNGIPGEHNALNQVLRMGDLECRYDPNGNLIQKGAIQYRYDSLDRLVEVTDETTHHHFSYDPFNRRISKNDERYLCLGDNEVGMVDSAGKICQLRVLGVGKGAEIGAAIAIELEGKAYIPVHDHRGSVVCLVDPQLSQPVQTYRYTAFGETLTDDTSGNPWRFSSKRYDDETHLINFGKRYYDPQLMRWLTPDPIDRLGGPNIYAYVMNNPLITIDLYGFFGAPAHSLGSGQHTHTPPRRSAWQRALSAPGHLLKTIGHHCPIPGLRDIVKFAGHTLAGHSPRHFIPTHKEQHSKIGIYPGKETPVPAVYLNGMNVSLKEVHEQAGYISKKLGGVRVYYVYNATHGLLNDLGEVGCQKVGIETNSVIKTFCCLKQLLKESPDGRIFVLAHSQGAETLYQSAKKLTADERQRIIGVTFGGARIIPRGYLNEVQNVVSRRDIIPYLANIIEMTTAHFSDSSNIRFLESNGHFFVDHAFLGETYSKFLQDEKFHYDEIIKNGS